MLFICSLRTLLLQPKRISVAAGIVHIIILLSVGFELTLCLVRMCALCAKLSLMSHTAL